MSRESGLCPKSSDEATGLRVAVVAPAAWGEGGLGTAARDFAEGAMKLKADVVYIGHSDLQTKAERLVQVRPLRRWPVLARELSRARILARVPSGIDAIYSMPGYLPKIVGSPLALHQATHHPSVICETMRNARRRVGGGRPLYTGYELRYLERELERADVIRAESHVVASELVEYGIAADRVVFCPPGVDLERFRPAKKPSQLTVAFVGTLSLWKGVHILETLAARLQAGGARLVVVGGPVCTWSRRIAERMPFDREDDVAAVLSQAHALVLPSISDGFGYVVLEAMASGAVPFVTPQVGAADVVGLVDPRLIIDANEFAETVPELLGELPLDTLATRCRTVAEQYERRHMGAKAAAAVLSALGILP
ncbi:MAG: glycosyltransferase family 4 protein [Dermatophilaceae bacterium]